MCMLQGEQVFWFSFQFSPVRVVLSSVLGFILTTRIFRPWHLSCTCAGRSARTFSVLAGVKVLALWRSFDVFLQEWRSEDLLRCWGGKHSQWWIFLLPNLTSRPVHFLLICHFKVEWAIIDENLLHPGYHHLIVQLFLFLVQGISKRSKRRVWRREDGRDGVESEWKL